MRKFIFIT